MANKANKTNNNINNNNSSNNKNNAAKSNSGVAVRHRRTLPTVEDGGVTTSTTITTKEDGSVITTTVRRIPPPPHQAAASSSKKKVNPAWSKQQRMLRQMRAHRTQARKENDALASYANQTIQDSVMKYVKSLLVILLAAFCVLYAYAPKVVARWFRPVPKLPDRFYTTVYPPGIHLRSQLPRVVSQYAIATPENEVARDALRHVHALRQYTSATTHTPKGYHSRVLPPKNGPAKWLPQTPLVLPPVFRQAVKLNAWDVKEFGRQLDNFDMDLYCGKGYTELYRSSSLDQDRRHDLLMACVLATGQHDGYVSFDLADLYASLVRGTQGLAVRYAVPADDPRNHYDNDSKENDEAGLASLQQGAVHTRSVLLLPIHSSAELAKKQPLGASTQVGFRLLEWVRLYAQHPDVHQYRTQLEQYLWTAIQAEPPERWTWWVALCDGNNNNSQADEEEEDEETARMRQQEEEERRQAFLKQYRLVGRTCPEEQAPTFATDKKECCLFFDTLLEPKPKARRRDDDDED